MNKKTNRLLIVSIGFLAFYAVPLFGDDWPQWRGPHRDGVWHDSGIVEPFSKKQLDIVWRAPISSGYSGPTVADGLVYVTDRLTEPKQVERILCFDATTGNPVWKYDYDCIYEKIGYKAGPRAAVLIHEALAYSLGSMGHFYCLDAKTGEVKWKKDLNALYQIDMPIWGIAAAPIIFNDLINAFGFSCIIRASLYSGPRN